MKRERGHAMIELAVSAAVMVAFVSATFQFGYTFYVYNQLLTAVGNGGRYAALQAYSPQDTDQTNRAIRNMVVFGDAQAGEGSQPVVPGLRPEQVDVRWIPNEAGTHVRVSIREFTINAVFRSFTFTGRPSVEFPNVGAPK